MGTLAPNERGIMKRYPLAHKIHMPERPYREAVNTDIRATIKAERKRLASEEVCKPVKADHTTPFADRAPWGTGPGEDLGRFNCAGYYMFPIRKAQK